MNPEQELQINQKVLIKLPGSTWLPAKITGIAWRNLVTGYIVTLDSPLQMSGFEGWTTMCVTPDMIIETG